MRKESPTNGNELSPTPGWLPVLGRAGVGFGLLLWALVVMAAAPAGWAQTLRLGPFDLLATGTLELGYDSNVDDVYPEEEDPDLQTGDFYWMPGVEIRSEGVSMRPSTTVDLSLALDYQDYFERSDLDTELYNAILNFQTVHPRLSLGGTASTEYSVESSKDQYIPGGVSRDPMKTDMGTVFFDWHYRKFRIETHADYTRERHDKEEYKAGDNDETVLFAGAYFDIYSWGSLFYSVEQTLTTYIQPDPDREEEDITKNFGFDGAIPLSWLEHPHITYSIGVKSEDSTTDPEKDATWEPSHTIRAEDELQLTKSTTLSGYVQWENQVYDDDIGFTYNLRLEQLVGSRAQHALYFEQEPESTLGSTTETETTTYGYDFGVKDLIFYNLFLNFNAIYEESTPLGVGERVTEETTTLTLNIGHTRQLSRKLSRLITYEYTWEDSNFHNDGAKQRHLVTYGFSYDF